MDTPNINVGELIEKGQTAVSNAAKSTVSDISDSVSGQIGFKNEPAANAQTQFQGQPQGQSGQQGETVQMQTERTREMIRDFYSPSNNFSQNSRQETLTEEQQLAQVRQKLYQEQHNETYYNPLFAYEHNLNKTESKAEKLEKEDKAKMMDLQQKEADKPPPLAVQRAKTHIEVNPGIAG